MKTTYRSRLSFFHFFTPLRLAVHDFRKDDDINPEDSDDDFDTLLSSLRLHSSSNYSNNSSKRSLSASCKCVAFSHDGAKIYTGGSPFGDLCAVDAERACTFSTEDKNKPMWRIKSATASTDVRDDNKEYNTNKTKNNPLVTLYPFTKDGEAGTPLLATGDDRGGIRIWDERLCGSGNTRPVLQWNNQEDYISGIEYFPQGNGKSGDGNNILLATSADGSLGVYDLRMNKGAIADTTRQSDHLDDELLSLCVLKLGKKVVCGTQTGALSIFSWGTWGDISDRFPGHPCSVETLLKIDEDTLLTGSSDGLIRVVQIHPDKFLGVLNDGDTSGSHNSDSDYKGHGGNPVEKLAFNANRDVVGSVSHDNFVRLWDSRILKDDSVDQDDEEEEENDENDEEDVRKPAAKSAMDDNAAVVRSKSDNTYNSDDEWEDMDDEDKIGSCADESDSDSDESVADPETANDRRKKRLKTENEKFFDDL
jgi:WD40 repeat protein